MGKNHINTKTVIYEDKDDTKHRIRRHLGQIAQENHLEMPWNESFENEYWEFMKCEFKLILHYQNLWCFSEWYNHVLTTLSIYASVQIMSWSWLMTIGRLRT